MAGQDGGENQFVTRGEFVAGMKDVGLQLQAINDKLDKKTSTNWPVVLATLTLAAMVVIPLVSVMGVHFNSKISAVQEEHREYKRITEAATQQVWRQQNSSVEKIENSINDILFDGYRRHMDSLSHGRE